MMPGNRPEFDYDFQRSLGILADFVDGSEKADNGGILSLLRRPLVAESGPSILWILGHLNVRFGEKRTFAIYSQFLHK